MKKEAAAMAKKILIVDDEINTRVNLGDILKEEGYDVVQASDGREALKMANRDNPDIVLLDTRLPDMDGNEVCAKLKKLRGFKAKVIVYTGYIDAIDVDKSKSAGADDYVVKTADFSLLLKAIKSLDSGK